MKIKTQRKGFTLAEVMITLLIVGIVTASTVPTLTKRQTGKDNMWDWASYPAGAAYTTGTHVVFDSTEEGNQVPVPKEGYFPALGCKKSELGCTPPALQTAIENASRPSQDKLIIVNNSSDSVSVTTDINADITKPHISLYNQRGNDLSYAGSLTADINNLGLGVGALQSMTTPTSQVSGANSGIYNTAIGHYTLFADKLGRQNTAFGNMALSSIGSRQESRAVASNNVAIGANVQKYSKGGIHNTAVGANALIFTNDNNISGANVEESHGNVTTQGSDNIALGHNALGAINSEGTLVSFQYGRSNIAIGANAGNVGDVQTIANAGNNLFIGALTETTNPLIEANMRNNSFFNINADELIVNTADGKHTILKVRMIEDQPVYLPIISSVKNDGGGYSHQYVDLSYCKGEGSDDIKRADNDPKALADVCIAKFAVNKNVTRGYGLGDADGNYKFGDALNGNLAPEVYETYDDWDIFLKDIRIGYDGGTSTGVNEPIHIQTVKAGLNYIERNKEGSGLIRRALGSLVQNIKCIFSFWFDGAGCDQYAFGNQTSIQGKLQDAKDQMKDFFSSLNDALSGKADEYAENLSAAERLKNWAEEQQKKACENLENCNGDCDRAHTTCETNCTNTYNSCTRGCSNDLTTCNNKCSNNRSSCGDRCDGYWLSSTRKLCEIDCDNRQSICTSACSTTKGLCDTGCSTKKGTCLCDTKRVACKTPCATLYGPTCNLSDKRLKNISGNNNAGLKEIKALKIKNYTYKADKKQTPHVGVIAQELQKVFPNSVFEGADGYLRIKQEEMFFAMINSIKELDIQDRQLKSEIPEVNKQINKAMEQNKILIDKNEALRIENEKLQAELEKLQK